MININIQYGEANIKAKNNRASISIPEKTMARETLTFI
jgi:hypothetical protein